MSDPQSPTPNNLPPSDGGGGRDQWFDPDRDGWKNKGGAALVLAAAVLVLVFVGV
jgi:hypothetical protein